MRNGARAEVIAVKIMSCRKMQVACDIVGWLHTEVDMVAFANSYMTLTERRIKNAESMHEFEIIAGLAVRVGWSRITFSELISKLHSAENLRELQAACEVAARFDKGADFLARSHGGASALASAKRRLQHVELLASLESNDPAVIKQAIAQAERDGLPQATLSAARERLNFLCLSQGSQSPVMQLGNALLVGRTEHHNKLAKLLGAALAENVTGDAVAQVLQNVFVPSYPRVFSCKPQDYGARGGRMYYKPVDWVRYALRIDDFDCYKDWCVGYHGTIHHHIIPLLVIVSRTEFVNGDHF